MAYTHAQGNEFWFQFDLRTKYSPAFGPTLGAAGAFDVQTVWHDARKGGQYPADLITFVNKAKPAWVAIAAIQSKTINESFGLDRDALRLAFEDFGQGVLLDKREPRLSNNDCIHMMDTGTAPPVGYHRWNAALRAIQTFDNDALWNELARDNALAWAIQSSARPKQSKVNANPPMNVQDLAKIRAAWMQLSQDEIDLQFDLGSGSEGYHPSPLNPLTP